MGLLVSTDLIVSFTHLPTTTRANSITRISDSLQSPPEIGGPQGATTADRGDFKGRGGHAIRLSPAETLDLGTSSSFYPFALPFLWPAMFEVIVFRVGK
jgi:hypothetical protein